VAAGALSHIKVLDLSRVLAGPWCGQNLADLGAEVIKVERPKVGDDTRVWGPPWLKTESGEQAKDSSYYSSANRGKKSITVNLADPQGQALIRELATWADVVLENYKVGDLARYGLDYASLSKVNPGIVFCSITGYGQDGPYADKPGYDFVFQGLGGLMSITGERDDREGGGPQKVGVAVADVLTGMYSTVAILAALHHRNITGKGQYIDMALLDCLVALGGNQAVSYLVTGKSPPRMGNEHQSLVPYQVFATSDGHVIIAVGNDGQWQRYCEAIERPDIATSPKWQKMTQRVIGRAELIPDLAKTMLTRTTAEWVERIEAKGVPCGPINNYDQVFKDPHVKHRGLLIEQTRSDGVKIPGVASPLRLQGTPVTYDRPPPALGEHTDEVLGKILGKSATDISALREKGVI
jgi:crotonobetainyl-CoA:carnitine CoA-transferase CaiB-like acyl-CoA transferase